MVRGGVNEILGFDSLEDLICYAHFIGNTSTNYLKHGLYYSDASLNSSAKLCTVGARSRILKFDCSRFTLLWTETSENVQRIIPGEDIYPFRVNSTTNFKKIEKKDVEQSLHKKLFRFSLPALCKPSNKLLSVKKNAIRKLHPPIHTASRFDRVPRKRTNSATFLSTLWNQLAGNFVYTSGVAPMFAHAPLGKGRKDTPPTMHLLRPLGADVSASSIEVNKLESSCASHQPLGELALEFSLQHKKKNISNPSTSYAFRRPSGLINSIEWRSYYAKLLDNKGYSRSGGGEKMYEQPYKASAGFSLKNRQYDQMIFNDCVIDISAPYPFGLVHLKQNDQRRLPCNLIRAKQDVNSKTKSGYVNDNSFREQTQVTSPFLKNFKGVQKKTFFTNSKIMMRPFIMDEQFPKVGIGSFVTRTQIPILDCTCCLIHNLLLSMQHSCIDKNLKKAAKNQPLLPVDPPSYKATANSFDVVCALHRPPHAASHALSKVYQGGPGSRLKEKQMTVHAPYTPYGVKVQRQLRKKNGRVPCTLETHPQMQQATWFTSSEEQGRQKTNFPAPPLESLYNKFHTLPIFSTLIYKEWSHRFSFLEYFIWSARKNDLGLPFYNRRGACHTTRVNSINLIRNQIGAEGMCVAKEQFLFGFNGCTRNILWNERFQKAQLEQFVSLEKENSYLPFSTLSEVAFSNRRFDERNAAKKERPCFQVQSHSLFASVKSFFAPSVHLRELERSCKDGLTEKVTKGKLQPLPLLCISDAHTQSLPVASSGLKRCAHYLVSKNALQVIELRDKSSSYAPALSVQPVSLKKALFSSRFSVFHFYGCSESQVSKTQQVNAQPERSGLFAEMEDTNEKREQFESTNGPCISSALSGDYEQGGKEKRTKGDLGNGYKVHQKDAFFLKKKVCASSVFRKLEKVFGWQSYARVDFLHHSNSLPSLQSHSLFASFKCNLIHDVNEKEGAKNDLRELESSCITSSPIFHYDAHSSSCIFDSQQVQRGAKNSAEMWGKVDDTQQFPRLAELLHFTGGTALRHLLSRFDLVLLGKFLRHELKNLELKVNFLLALKMLTYSQGLLLGKLAKRRSKQIRRLKLLELFQSKKSNPEWMILSVLPVLPPDLRPILRVNDDFVVASDLNRLYQTVLRRNNTIHERLDDPLPCPESGLFRQRSLQKAVDGLLENGKGGGTPLCASKRRPLVSLSHVLKGKKGLFRQHLLGKRVDYSGRSVIVVGPKLNLHECGLPKEMALELFQPFLIHRLKVKGLATSNTTARRMIQQEDPIIWHTVKQLVYEHPVLLNRAPTLHRLGIQAFQPRLVSGRAILLHPLVCNGFNADFDGDQMAVHVPLSFQARAEAWKIMWSKNNLLSPATGQPILVPSQDMVLGCYYLSVLVPRVGSFKGADETLPARASSMSATRAEKMHSRRRFDTNPQKNDYEINEVAKRNSYVPSKPIFFPGYFKKTQHLGFLTDTNFAITSSSSSNCKAAPYVSLLSHLINRRLFVEPKATPFELLKKNTGSAPLLQPPVRFTGNILSAITREKLDLKRQCTLSFARQGAETDVKKQVLQTQVHCGENSKSVTNSAYHLKRGHYFSSLQDSLMAYSQGRLQTHTPFWVRLDYSVADVKNNGTISPLVCASIDIRFSTSNVSHVTPGQYALSNSQREFETSYKGHQIFFPPKVHLKEGAKTDVKKQLLQTQMHCGENSKSPISIRNENSPPLVLLKTAVVPSSKKRISQLLCDNTCTHYIRGVKSVADLSPVTFAPKVSTSLVTPKVLHVKRCGSSDVNSVLSGSTKVSLHPLLYTYGVLPRNRRIKVQPHHITLFTLGANSVCRLPSVTFLHSPSELRLPKVNSDNSLNPRFDGKLGKQSSAPKVQVVGESSGFKSATNDIEISSLVANHALLLQPHYGCSQELSKVLMASSVHKKDHHRCVIEGNDTLEAPLELRLAADGNLVKISTTFQNQYNFNATILDQYKERSIRYMRTTAGRVVINDKIVNLVNKNVF